MALSPPFQHSFMASARHTKALDIIYPGVTHDISWFRALAHKMRQEASTLAYDDDDVDKVENYLRMIHSWVAGAAALDSGERL